MVEWRCATRDSGKHCVMTPGIGFGIPMMQKLSANNLVSSQDVRENVLFPEEDFPEPIMHG